MPKKTRILFTIPNFKTAGSQYVVLALLKRLDSTHFTPFIAVERFPECIPEWIPKDYQIVCSRSGSLWKDARAFSKLLKQHHIDLVHSWDYKSAFVEAIGCKLAGVPYLYTKKNNAWSKRWFLKSFLATHIAYDNPEMKARFFSHRLLRNKISFIPHGVDTTLFKPEAKKKKDSNTFRLCTVGNIGDNKNQLFLIEALQKLPKLVEVNLYGKADPDYLARVEKTIAMYQLEDRVHLKGFVANEALPEILRQQDVFVLPSKKEGLPVSVLEALACGVPVLCSDSGGGARYIFGNLATEHIFEVNNQEGFISRLKPLLEDASYYSKKQQQAIEIAEEFEVQKEVASYANLYKHLV